ncbi:HERV-H LTR-associating protein 2 [Collichthys lucidus]|uniref:HERV-H LTR-associating protein 2 n=1 Tax=Collichthys lucidus TaxID=240159 RepID=A0A4U5VGK2_COLLU|nr:HERV-H LTR-associating protein 2 [Collichthys lucidus]
MNLRTFTWKMPLTKCPVFALVLSTFLTTFNRGGAEVCLIMQSCILPCSFKPGDDAVIHWVEDPDKTPVHSYYYNQDQVALQGPRYRGRTSLFKDQISRGNASLLLRRTEVQDKGTYKCYTSTTTGNRELFISIDVEAPVREVNIQKKENIITCSSEGIYPAPKLTWSTDPPSNVTDEGELETVQQIYNVKSSLVLSDGVALDYSCTISNGRRARTASWYKPTSINVSNSETTIPCKATDPPRTRLVWTFNQSQVILNQTGDSPYTASERWEKLVKAVLESGDLTLQHLSSDHDGMYTCEQSNDEETRITNSVLRIENSSGNPALIAGVVVGVILAIIFVVLLIKRKSICKNRASVL